MYKFFERYVIILLIVRTHDIGLNRKQHVVLSWDDQKTNTFLHSFRHKLRIRSSAFEQWLQEGLLNNSKHITVHPHPEMSGKREKN